MKKASLICVGRGGTASARPANGSTAAVASKLQRGVSLAEVGIVMALVTVICIGAYTTFGNHVSTLVTPAANVIH